MEDPNPARGSAAPKQRVGKADSVRKRWPLKAPVVVPESDGLLDFRFREQLGAGHFQGTGEALERIQGHHALAAFDFADVSQAQRRFERELLLRQLARFALGADGVAKLALELRGTVGHTDSLARQTAGVCQL